MGCKPTVELHETSDEENDDTLHAGTTIKATNEEKKRLEELMKIEAAGKISTVVSPEQKNIWKHARAKKLFKQMDKDGSGHLNGDELKELAVWVQHSLYPKGLFPDKVFSAAETTKMCDDIKEACDKNKDNKVDAAEFETYYCQICKEVSDLHAESNAKINEAKVAAAAAAKIEADAIKEKMRIEKNEKRMHEEANDVPPFMDSKMKSVRKTTSLLKYSNLMCEFIYQSARDEDNWDHSERFDFKGVPHVMTVL